MRRQGRSARRPDRRSGASRVLLGPRSQPAPRRSPAVAGSSTASSGLLDQGDGRLEPRPPPDRRSSRRWAQACVSKANVFSSRPIPPALNSGLRNPAPAEEHPPQPPPKARTRVEIEVPVTSSPPTSSIKTVKIRAPTVPEQIGERRFRSRSRPSRPPSQRRARSSNKPRRRSERARSDPDAAAPKPRGKCSLGPASLGFGFRLARGRRSASCART